ncbi:MAG: ACP S-malonyltransferase [Lachnospiraceae bacterium]|nr:ACP S-malonyltransferase [Lachnospiraceae bacterium]
MMGIAFVFPGQGAQKVGMARDFYDNSDVSRKIFELADENLDFDIKKVCFEENKEIDITEYTQAALLTACLSMYKELEKYNLKPDVCAGLSLGEYAAMAVCGVMSFEDAVRAVRKRGKLMQEAVPYGIGSMAAVIGLENEIVEKVCNDIEGVEVANYNCPGQVVISGIDKSVKKASEQLTEEGARRVLPLNVSGPFHSSMLKDAGEKLGEFLDTIEINNPKIPYVTNVTAEYINENTQIKDLLKKQVCSSVKWQQSVENMIKNGIDTFIEIGPGRTITGFVKKIDSSVKLYNIQKFEDVEKVVRALEGEN